MTDAAVAGFTSDREHDVSELGGKLGRFVLFLQVSWRPVLAWQTIAEMTCLSLLAMYETFTHDIETLNAALQWSGFLTTYLGMKFAVIGVNSIGRTAEKIWAPGKATP